MSNTTPPGWYDDGQGGRRWWDGSQWAAPGQGPSDQPQPTQQLPQQDPGQSYGQPYGQSYGQQPGQPPSQPPYGAPGQPAYGAGQQPYGQQPQYAQPYGQAPYGGTPPKKKTGLIIGIVVGVLVLIGGGVLAAVLLSGDGGDGKGDKEASGDDPAETVQAYFDAAKDGDCDKAIATLTEGLKKELGANCDEELNPDGRLDDVKYDVGDADENGDKATVPVTISGIEGAGEIKSDYELTKVDGTWLISSFGNLDLGSSSAPSAEAPTMPSDIPTDLPTDIPTDFPTDVPTELDIPTDFPTDPDDLQSYLEELESAFPSDFPS
ncbi:DUF4878 domain-containing protein [Nocardioides plantarum]|uniref:DUF4878 domain-containing protein n=1 Tax=Nocardioides plantarum TaxID=29299 RepID=A0ABV5KBW6_9ACTN|nr:DUF4878 domain-containing protein [Nocardioides plantarum]